MKTETIQALLAGKTVQVNSYPINIDSKQWIDLNPKNREHYHFYASLFTDNEEYPLFRIKPEPRIITYKLALLKNSEEGFWIFTVNSPEKAASLEKEYNFIKWITNWKTYGIVED